MTTADKEPLGEMTTEELREIGRATGVVGYSGMRKDELVAAIERARENAPAQRRRGRGWW